MPDTVALTSEGTATNGQAGRSVPDADKDKYKFSNDSANPYQTVRGWLLSYLSLTRGIGANTKDKGEMPDDEKSTNPGLSAAERKALRVREAQEAIADREEAQTAFHENRERLPKERLVSQEIGTAVDRRSA